MPHVQRTVSVLVLLASLYLSETKLTGRPLLQTSGSQHPSDCRNTVQGIYLVADDKGKVCNRSELDYATGCCKAGIQYACDRCKVDDNCCSEFENCVSCCLDPKQKAAERMKQAPRIRDRPDLGHWDNPFSFCMASCRTHRRSTVHENSYLGNRHHCFSPLGKPLLTGPAPKPLAAANTSMILSNNGESCTSACQRKSMHCAPALLPLLNDCDRLREHFACEAGCTGFTNQPFHPAYVDTSAPKPLRPAMCMVTASQPSLDCDAHEQHIHRLCPCLSQPRPVDGGATHLRGQPVGTQGA